MITIEKARTNEIYDMCILLKTLFSKEKEFEPDFDKQKRGLEMIIENSDIGFINLIKDNGKIVGMVSILYTVSTFLGEKAAVLEDMVMSEKYIGKGFGTMLIKKSILEAESNGVKRVTLLTDKNNDKSVKFYKKNGFINSDMIVMRKYL